MHHGLGSSLFARRYLGNRFFFLFLQVLRCFSSLRLPRLRVTVINCRVPPFGYLWISAYLQLPKAFRCSSRPSSAPSAKAFTVRPSLLNHNFCANFYLHFSSRICKQIRTRSISRLIISSFDMIVFLIVRIEQLEMRYSVFNDQSLLAETNNGEERDRTADLLRAKQALSQLS